MAALASFTAMNLRTQWGELLKAVLQTGAPHSLAQTKKWIGETENAVNTNIWKRFDFIDSYAYMQVLMGKSESGAFDVVQGLDRDIVWGNLYQKVTDNLDEYALRVKRLGDFAARHGARTLFLNPLALVVRGHSRYSAGIPAYDENPDQEAMLFYLQSLGVDYLDGRESLENSSLPKSLYRFRTDHHWTIEASFEVFKSLVEKLDRDYGANLDPDGFYRDIGNYNVRKFPGSFLGSLGRRSGAVFSGFDDFTVIWPKFETEFVKEWRNTFGMNLSEGDITESLLSLERWSLPADAYNGATKYDTYAGHIWAKITNKLKPNGPKLMMIHDSQAQPLYVFLAPLFSEMYLIWPEAPGEKENVEKYVREHADEFDYVIVERAPSNWNEEGFDFFREPLER
jgi:hypothetical protein